MADRTPLFCLQFSRLAFDITFEICSVSEVTFSSPAAQPLPTPLLNQWDVGKFVEQIYEMVENGDPETQRFVGSMGFRWFLLTDKCFDAFFAGCCWKTKVFISCWQVFIGTLVQHMCFHRFFGDFC